MSQAEQRIRERAYQLWQQAGCPAGRSEDFWFAAQREIEGDVPPVGDRPGGAIDYPPESQSVEEPPTITARAEAAGGTADTRRGDPAQTPRPAEPAAAEAPVPAEDSRPVRAARAVATPGAKKAASSEDTPSAGRRPGKPAPRPGRR